VTIVFRPCIDLRGGKVVQIVGGTLDDARPDSSHTRTNFESDRPSSYFASRYRDDQLGGGHVIMLGPGNEVAAHDALAAWPGGMQVGGGVSAGNATEWLDAGASHVIVTSWLFVDGALSADRVAQMVDAVGRDRLVIDLSCRTRDGEHWIVTDRWQHFTAIRAADALPLLADSCAEFLVHGVDVEGLTNGIDHELVAVLVAAGVPNPITYAGGARSLDDLRLVTEIGDGRIDLTIGSALDLFGGTGVRYTDCVEFNRQHAR
jgi:phosphoribosylformimino-5-aminoimidazole carboxamide ribotide isomerase